MIIAILVDNSTLWGVFGFFAVSFISLLVWVYKSNTSSTTKRLDSIEEKSDEIVQNYLSRFDKVYKTINASETRIIDTVNKNHIDLIDRINEK